jgi:hypothetical protein
MATFVRFHQFAEDLAKGVHNLATGDLRYALTNAAPDAAADAVLADLTSVLSAGNGYPSGGIALTGTTVEQSGGIAPLLTDDKTLTASGGSIGPFRYVVLYNNTPTSPADPLIGYWDRGSSVTLNDGDSVVLDADPVNGLFEVGN